MNKYSDQLAILVAIDCITFGCKGDGLKLLLIQRGFESIFIKRSF